MHILYNKDKVWDFLFEFLDPQKRRSDLNKNLLFKTFYKNWSSLSKYSTLFVLPKYV